MSQVRHKVRPKLPNPTPGAHMARNRGANQGIENIRSRVVDWFKVGPSDESINKEHKLAKEGKNESSDGYFSPRN